MIKEVRMEISTRSTTAMGYRSLCWLTLRRTTHAQPLGKQHGTLIYDCRKVKESLEVQITYMAVRLICNRYNHHCLFEAPIRSCGGYFYELGSLIWP